MTSHRATGVPFAHSNMACELVTRRPNKRGSRKVIHCVTGTLVGHIFKVGSSWAYTLTASPVRSGSTDCGSGVKFKTMRAAKAALAGEL